MNQFDSSRLMDVSKVHSEPEVVRYMDSLWIKLAMRRIVGGSITPTSNFFDAMQITRYHFLKGQVSVVLVNLIGTTIMLVFEKVYLREWLFAIPAHLWPLEQHISLCLKKCTGDTKIDYKKGQLKKYKAYITIQYAFVYPHSLSDSLNCPAIFIVSNR